MKKVWIIGATWGNPNKGICALLEATVTKIITTEPETKIAITGWPATTTTLELYNGPQTVSQFCISFGKNIARQHHFVRMILSQCLPKKWTNKNPYLSEFNSVTHVLDITGGDSFSDIYGTWGLIKSSLVKWLCIITGKKLVFLPQTYGPFKSLLSKMIARYLLSRASKITTRDPNSVNNSITFVPDLAFILHPEDPKDDLQAKLNAYKESGRDIIGINVSGLLYNKPKQAQHRFALNENHNHYIEKLVTELITKPNTLIVLIPHVYGTKNQLFDKCDYLACEAVYNKFKDEYKDQLMLINKQYNHRQIKYCIGQCSIFIGARMHACIGALSQYVPTIGLAYSAKFEGVFESVDVKECVIDLRYKTTKTVQEIIRKKSEIKERLVQSIPQAQAAINQFVYD